MSAQPTLSPSITLLAGGYFSAGRIYFHSSTDTANTKYVYALSGGYDGQWYISYNWDTGKWFDNSHTNENNHFGTSASDISTTAEETGVDPEYVHVFGHPGSGAVGHMATFLNPYYGTYSSGNNIVLNQNGGSATSTTPKKVFANFW